MYKITILIFLSLSSLFGKIDPEKQKLIDKLINIDLVKNSTLSMCQNKTVKYVVNDTMYGQRDWEYIIEKNGNAYVTIHGLVFHMRQELPVTIKFQKNADDNAFKYDSLEILNEIQNDKEAKEFFKNICPTKSELEAMQKESMEIARLNAADEAEAEAEMAREEIASENTRNHSEAPFKVRVKKRVSDLFGFNQTIPIVEIISISNSLTVKNVIANRGNCKMTAHRQKAFPHKLKYGEIAIAGYTARCELFEIKVITDKGYWVFDE